MGGFDETLELLQTLATLAVSMCNATYCAFEVLSEPVHIPAGDIPKSAPDDDDAPSHWKAEVSCLGRLPSDCPLC